MDRNSKTSFQNHIDLSEKIIKSLNLDLNGITLLTEVGSGPYVLAPIIAAMANSKKVMAWTYDSEYGKAREIINECRRELSSLGLDRKVEFHNGRFNPEHIEKADIITNSGFLRPLDSMKLNYCKNEIVIPLMYEAWELRNQDIDMDFCNSKGIKVAGTWENHPKINAFKCVGSLAIKMTLESGYKISGQNIIIWSDDPFGEYIKESFIRYGANRVVNTVDFEILKNIASTSDFIFIGDYSEMRDFSDNSFFSLKDIIRINPDIGIIHLYGTIFFEPVREMGLKIYPEKNGYAQKMSFAFNHIGPEPVINLIAAGLKVGELVVKNIPDELVQPVNFRF